MIFLCVAHKILVENSENNLKAFLNKTFIEEFAHMSSYFCHLNMIWKFKQKCEVQPSQYHLIFLVIWVWLTHFDKFLKIGIDLTTYCRSSLTSSNDRYLTLLVWSKKFFEIKRIYNLLEKFRDFVVNVDEHLLPPRLQLLLGLGKRGHHLVV